jgi:hypothetical protein
LLFYTILSTLLCLFYKPQLALINNENLNLEI